MTFVRSDDYMERIFLDAMDREVHLDTEVVINWSFTHRKLKAYCPKVDCYLQFPNALRKERIIYTCDIIKAQSSGKPFYRAYKGSIRDPNGNVVG